MSESKTSKILILGMVNITDEYANELKKRQDAKKNNLDGFPPGLRDYNRIQEIQDITGQRVVTVSKSVYDHPLSEFHVEGYFHRRLVKNMKSKTSTDGPYNLILCDYIFFDAEYMRRAYGKLCDRYNGLLPELHKKEMLAENVEIYVPVPQILEEDSPYCAESKIFDIEPVTNPFDNPLVHATGSLPQTKMGLFTNEEQLAKLDKDAPFLKLTLKVK